MSSSLIIRTRKQLFEFCEKLIKDATLKEQREKIYTDLLKLPEGYQFNLSKTWTDIDNETKYKICCLFISENMGYSFSDDFQYIRRNR